MQKLYANQLAAQLSQGLAGCYLIFGEEPLQKLEAIDALRQAAKQQGYDERLSFTLDSQFDWAQLHNELSAMSLFSAKRLIELELSQKLSAAASDQLKQLAHSLSADIVLVLHGQRGFGEVSKLAWFKQLQQVAIQVAIYPLDDRQARQWLQQRANVLNLRLSADAFSLLQHHSAGNLLAARQELEKLALTHPNQMVDAAVLANFLADHSSFTVFQLGDAILAGDGQQALHRLHRLLQQDMEPAIIIWQLQKDLQQLQQLQYQQQQGIAPAQTFKQLAIWPKRQPLYQQALQRLSLNYLDYLLQELAAFDRLYKGGQLADLTTALSHLVCLFIKPVPRTYSLQQQHDD
ncbi:MAG: DNA polymerase III subunit delta [Rheinheimera sp.]|uniref:DNA polymerase III subunit delta n=1 Tax=Arsukibacterium sp. UBA3155 TaxID=1946058 RepID=UPI000C8A5213|nr:DNA polymerase III subunit delta [Arsukibacterium sp. UBA3155]MAD75339.1 DNA polymerase III subunit delta [Rheinheimera sp.]|tara:strand:- start:157705 stop:158748 length:1044 start_codon:yes stop_codon:yes gene_type:complete